MSNCKAVKQYGILKSTLLDRKNNSYETAKVWQKNDLTDEEEQAIKTILIILPQSTILYQYLQLRLLPGPSPKEVPFQTDLIQRPGLVISGTKISKQGTTWLTESQITLIVEDRGQLLSPEKRNIPIQKAKEHGSTSPSMHVCRHQVTLCHPISFSPSLIHLVLMLEMDQMEHYTLYNQQQPLT